VLHGPGAILAVVTVRSSSATNAGRALFEPAYAARLLTVPGQVERGQHRRAQEGQEPEHVEQLTPPEFVAAPTTSCEKYSMPSCTSTAPASRGVTYVPEAAAGPPPRPRPRRGPHPLRQTHRLRPAPVPPVRDQRRLARTCPDRLRPARLNPTPDPRRRPCRSGTETTALPAAAHRRPHYAQCREAVVEQLAASCPGPSTSPARSPDSPNSHDQSTDQRRTRPSNPPKRSRRPGTGSRRPAARPNPSTIRSHRSTPPYQ
jgi:hypothetical protein